MGEQVLLIEPQVLENQLPQIHSLANLIEEERIAGIIDIVPAYQSLAIFFDTRIESHKKLIDILSKLRSKPQKDDSKTLHEILVCYELGLDWEEVTEYSQINREEFIKQHSSRLYTVAMMGFIPGFIFLDGLSKELSIPRRKSPRTSIPLGSVGIGGSQTGIYSLESPGGWNMIGRTRSSFFDITKTPPSQLKAGDSIKFKPISLEEFKDV